MLVPSGNNNPPPNVYYDLAFETRAILRKLEIATRISALHGISKTSVTRTLEEAEAFHLCCLRTAEISTRRPISQGNPAAPPNWHLLQQSIPRDQFTLLYVTIPRSGDKSTPTKPEIHLTSSFVRKQWKKPPPTPDDNPTMSTRQTERARQQREKKAAEAALQQQMEQTRLKQLEEKKKRDAERKKEEELRKITEAEQRKAEEVAPAEATVVSPTTQMEEDRADPSINSHLMDMMQGGTEDNLVMERNSAPPPNPSKRRLPLRKQRRPSLQLNPRSRVRK